jgi:hypothetical protein
MDYKKVLQRITVLFILLLLILTFFSQTLLDLWIPRVSLVLAKEGTIAPEAMASGVVEPIMKDLIFTPVSGIITQMMERGDEINNSSVLFTVRNQDGETTVTYNAIDYPNLSIWQIATGISLGMPVTEGALAMTIAINNEEFHIKASFLSGHTYINPGVSASIVMGNLLVQGVVTKIIPNGLNNEATVEFTSKQFKGGERVSVYINDTPTVHDYVIPLNALRFSNEDIYLLFAEAEKRWFNVRYIVRRQRVDIIKQDMFNAAINNSFGENITDAPIIVNSDMPVEVGSPVRFVGADELY